MNLDKQRLVLSCLVANRDLMALCSSIIKPSYFDASLKKCVKFINEYFEKYKDIPKISTVQAETGITLDDLGSITRADSDYIAAEIESYCRERAITEAIIAGPELLQKGDFGKILETLKSALNVGLQKDLGTDFFNDPAGQLVQMLESQAKISTGLPELDSAIGGGISRQELMVLCANSGGGKSMTMLNIALNLLKQGLNGVYISLEMAESVVTKRLYSMISKIGQDSLLKDINSVVASVEQARETMGKFIIKRMPENRTNVNTVRSYLQQLEQSTGFRPDFIVIDYLDIMGTTMQVAGDNLFVKDKYTTEEVRSLGFDFNAVVISASQLGRAALEADKLSQAHIQGGISKINTSDYTIGIKQDDLMRAAGEIYLEILKSRNSAGTGKRILLGWDQTSLTISSLEKKASNLTVQKKTGVLSASNTLFNKPKDETGGIINLMNT